VDVRPSSEHAATIFGSFWPTGVHPNSATEVTGVQADFDTGPLASVTMRNRTILILMGLSPGQTEPVYDTMKLTTAFSEFHNVLYIPEGGIAQMLEVYPYVTAGVHAPDSYAMMTSMHDARREATASTLLSDAANAALADANVQGGHVITMFPFVETALVAAMAPPTAAPTAAPTTA
jgi:hypothetical protein